MANMLPSGNVFCNPGEPGKRLNEQNVREMKSRGVTRFGSVDGVALAAEPSNRYGMTEVDDEGHQPPTAEAQAIANVQEVLSSLSGLRSQMRQGNRQATAMIQTLAATERAMPGGGRATVLRRLAEYGV